MTVDTTVQPKNVMFPTDARLMHRARERLVRLAKRLGVELRQTYERVGKLALIKHQRYAHAKQFKRANKALRTLRPQLGRVIRDIRRKIGDDEVLNAAFAMPLSLANRVREQRQRQRGQKVYSLHAPEVKCIGKGKAHKPYEFGVNLSRIVADAGYKGHNAPEKHKLKVFTSGQKRGVTDSIKKALRRRAAVEPVIGHLKAEHRMGRNYLARRSGDAINAVLAAVGYNFSPLLKWLRLLLAILAVTIIDTSTSDAA